MYLSFVNECCVKGKADFFDPVKNINLDIGLKKMKRIQKAISVMKEDGQAFGVICWGGEVKLEEALQYPVTSVSLSLAFPTKIKHLKFHLTATTKKSITRMIYSRKEDKFSSLFKRYGCSCFDGLCLST